jgi:hypothetical protein
MITINTIVITVVLISLVVLALSIRIVLAKDGKFPETHISRNPEMKKRGIHCVKTMDSMEQSKIDSQDRYKNVTLLK